MQCSVEYTNVNPYFINKYLEKNIKQQLNNSLNLIAISIFFQIVFIINTKYLWTWQSSLNKTMTQISTKLIWILYSNNSVGFFFDLGLKIDIDISTWPSSNWWPWSVTFIWQPGPYGGGWAWAQMLPLSGWPL